MVKPKVSKNPKIIDRIVWMKCRIQRRISTKKERIERRMV
jgi:hypothetical protein